MTKIHPFIKWVGGKTQSLNEIFKHFPIKLNNYYEPFCGSCAVLFELLNKLEENNDYKILGNIYINDINKKLINTYFSIKSDVNNLIKELKELEYIYNSAENIKYESRHKFNININDDINIIKQKGKSYVYYYYRLIYNKSPSSSLFIFLNKTCYRGLYRENKNGMFNVPFGSYESPNICDEDNLNNISILLNKYKVNICNSHFTDFLTNHKYSANDFIYIDPPYFSCKDINCDNKVFTDYNLSGFNDSDTNNLINMCDSFPSFLLSNSMCVHTLYLFNHFKIEKIKSRRRINSKNPEKTIHELLVYKNC
jgi:DNA adenine methylase